MLDPIQELIKAIAGALLDTPGSLKIHRYEDEARIVYFVYTAPGEEKNLIGPAGSTANTIRHLLKVASRRIRKKFVYLDVVSPDRRFDEFSLESGINPPARSETA